MSLNDCEGTMGVIFGDTNKLYLAGKFAKTESMNNKNQLYFSICLQKIKSLSKKHNQSSISHYYIFKNLNYNYLKSLNMQSVFKFPRLSQNYFLHVKFVYWSHCLKILSTLSTGLNFLTHSSNILSPFTDSSTEALSQDVSEELFSVVLFHLLLKWGLHCKP